MACSFVGDYVVTTKDAIDTLIKHGKGTGAYRAVKEKAIQSWRDSVDENMNAFAFLAKEGLDVRICDFTDAAGRSFWGDYFEPFLHSDDLLELPKYCKKTLIPFFAQGFAKELSHNPAVAGSAWMIELYADLLRQLADGWKPFRYVQIGVYPPSGKAYCILYGFDDDEDEDDDEVCWD